MTVVLDAGGLLALEAGDRRLLAHLKGERLAGRTACTHGGVVGQVWRGGSGRQAPLAHALRHVATIPLDDALGRRAGSLLATSRTSDVIDAAVVLIADTADRIFTSDPDDIEHLARAAGADVEIVAI
ncbi:MAG TPA: hypothetical protein DEQ43_01980 [Nocardioides bacterium]|nr:hypothetical protein [Nocardioides sp.]HRK44255.1 hypothetical protein [Nocardioides sp.]